MTVRLLQMSNGHVSLEFETDDIPAVSAAIRDRFGVPSKREHPFSTEYGFGGCSFTFQNEWDDPCLISGST